MLIFLLVGRLLGLRYLDLPERLELPEILERPSNNREILIGASAKTKCNKKYIWMLFII